MCKGIGFNFSLKNLLSNFYLLTFCTRNTNPNKFLKNIKNKKRDAVSFVRIGIPDKNFCLHK